MTCARACSASTLRRRTRCFAPLCSTRRSPMRTRPSSSTPSTATHASGDAGRASAIRATGSESSRLGAILKSIDAQMRVRLDFPHPLHAPKTPKYLLQIIDKEIDRWLEWKRAHTPRRIDIDLSKLGGIRPGGGRARARPCWWTSERDEGEGVGTAGVIEAAEGIGAACRIGLAEGAKEAKEVETEWVGRATKTEAPDLVLTSVEQGRLFDRGRRGGSFGTRARSLLGVARVADGASRADGAFGSFSGAVCLWPDRCRDGVRAAPARRGARWRRNGVRWSVRRLCERGDAGGRHQREARSTHWVTRRSSSWGTPLLSLRITCRTYGTSSRQDRSFERRGRHGNSCERDESDGDEPGRDGPGGGGPGQWRPGGDGPGGRGAGAERGLRRSGVDQGSPAHSGGHLMLKGGVVPRIGLPYITVGREVEIRALLTDLDLIADGGASFRFLVGRYGAGKSFLLQTIRTHAMGENFVVADAGPLARAAPAGRAGPGTRHLPRAGAQPLDQDAPRGRGARARARPLGRRLRRRGRGCRGARPRERGAARGARPRLRLRPDAHALPPRRLRGGR